MPVFFHDVLNARGLMDAYLARPPYQQNDYIGWITCAKLETTKHKRLNQMLNEFVNSSRKCNGSMVEHLKGCFETKSFTWSEIQF
ncbi:MAG: YdeI/OmpD-associated family protein [Chloroflexi bacterium]|nr:YdeI/OmpD-associated family protein [Chloroflexota bacterium]